VTTIPPRGQVPANHYATAAVCARAHGKLSTKLTIILNPPKLTAKYVGRLTDAYQTSQDAKQ
jgi:hypothetical protein